MSYLRPLATGAVAGTTGHVLGFGGWSWQQAALLVACVASYGFAVVGRAH